MSVVPSLNVADAAPVRPSPIAVDATHVPTCCCDCAETNDPDVEARSSSANSIPAARFAITDTVQPTFSAGQWSAGGGRDFPGKSASVRAALTL